MNLLIDDPLLHFRYHCCTQVGVHSIVLPWMEKMTTFFENDEENKDGLLELAQDQPCIVEHVVCTKPTPSTKVCALKGFTFATNPLFGPSLLCLTSDDQCIALPILTSFRPAPPPLLSTANTSSEEPTEHVEVTSAVPNIMQTDFEQHIRSILKRDTSQPVLRYEQSSRESLLDSECSHMISRVTQVLRREYILKQKLARDAIEKRTALIAQQKMQQSEDLAILKDKQQDLTDNAERLAEKYEECLERQEELANGLEVVLKHVQSKVPVLSKAEIEMAKELKSMLDQMKHLQNKIKQVQSKFEYQNKQKQVGDGQRKSDQSPNAVNPVQTQKFKDILLEKGQKIHELVKKLNYMKAQVRM